MYPIGASQGRAATGGPTAAVAAVRRSIHSHRAFLHSAIDLPGIQSPPAPRAGRPDGRGAGLGKRGSRTRQLAERVRDEGLCCETMEGTWAPSSSSSSSPLPSSRSVPLSGCSSSSSAAAAKSRDARGDCTFLIAAATDLLQFIQSAVSIRQRLKKSCPPSDRRANGV